MHPKKEWLRKTFLFFVKKSSHFRKKVRPLRKELLLSLSKAQYKIGLGDGALLAFFTSCYKLLIEMSLTSSQIF